MALRFHRSINLIPGLKLNLGKKGISASIGARGAWFTVGAKGTRTTLGVPGTGLSYSAYTPYKTHNHKSHETTTVAITPPIAATAPIPYDSAAIAPPNPATASISYPSATSIIKTAVMAVLG